MISRNLLHTFLLTTVAALTGGAVHRVERIDVRDPAAFDNRLITFEDLKAAGEFVGDTGSINGPSMLYVPEGTPNKLANYYLYFVDHGGDHISMAYSDVPTGPFTLYRPNEGLMSLSGANTVVAGEDRV